MKVAILKKQGDFYGLVYLFLPCLWHWYPYIFYLFFKCILYVNYLFRYYKVYIHRYRLTNTIFMLNIVDCCFSRVAVYLVGVYCVYHKGLCYVQYSTNITLYIHCLQRTNCMILNLILSMQIL